MKLGRLVLIAALPALLIACGGEQQEDAADKVKPEEAAPVAEQPKAPAEVMGWPTTPFTKHQFDSVVAVLEAPDRAEWQKRDKVLESFGGAKGKVVADIGAGTGYFTFPLAAEAARVIAIDIDQAMLDHIDTKKAKGKNTNIETRLGTRTDPGLAAGEADIALFVNTYSQIKNRKEYLANLKNGLNEGGYIVIVDFFKYSDNVKILTGPSSKYKLLESDVVEELKAAGFTNVRSDNTTLPYQYIVKAK